MLKLSKYGISGKILDWIEAFLTKRRQRVVLGESISEWKDVISGVPQGSVIGPVLFIIYINDLPDNLSNITKIYADDTKILGRIRKNFIEQDTLLMQEDINKVYDWTNTWLMRLNIEKCKIMHIGKKNNSHNYTLSNYNNNERISLVKTDIGILISKDLKFEAQVNKAASKANMSLGMLKSTFKSRDAIMWKKIYTTYVRPHLEYAIPVWNPFLKGDIEKLEKIQHRATKISHSMKGL